MTGVRDQMASGAGSGKLARMPRTTRDGFTLIEIMVSILIFVVVSAAMIGILMVATDLFRRGEFSRAANDETVAVVGSLEDDLKHLVPAADGGWLFSSVLGNGTGNCLIAFVIANPDPSLILSDGSNSRLLVAYWVDPQDQLRRASSPLVITSVDPTGSNSKSTFLGTIGANGTGGGPSGAYTDNRVVTHGCLHFGVWLVRMGDPTMTVPYLTGTSGGIDWERSDGGAHGSILQPWIGQEFDTDPPAGSTTSTTPFPTAMRLSLVLTGGGRFAPKGQVIDRSVDPGATTFRIGGITSLSTAPGAMLRIDSAAAGAGGVAATEWIEYSGFQSGMVTVVRRGARRTTASAHTKGDVVRVGQTYSIVRAFPQ